MLSKKSAVFDFRVAEHNTAVHKGTHTLGQGMQTVIAVDTVIATEFKRWANTCGLPLRVATSLALAQMLSKQNPSRAGRPKNRSEKRYKLVSGE